MLLLFGLFILFPHLFSLLPLLFGLLSWFPPLFLFCFALFSLLFFLLLFPCLLGPFLLALFVITFLLLFHSSPVIVAPTDLCHFFYFFNLLFSPLSFSPSLCSWSCLFPLFLHLLLFYYYYYILYKFFSLFFAPVLLIYIITYKLFSPSLYCLLNVSFIFFHFPSFLLTFLSFCSHFLFQFDNEKHIYLLFFLFLHFFFFSFYNEILIKLKLFTYSSFFPLSFWCLFFIM